MNKIIKHKDYLIFYILMLFSGILSMCYGIERTYDTRNYHIYNPYAFLNDRLTIDIMPSGIQSYYNPLLDIPYYLAIKYMNNHPFFITFLCGFSYALLLFIIYKITKFIFKEYKPRIITIISVLLASGISLLIRFLGWMSHDIFVADLILIGLYFILKSLNNKYHPILFLLSGFLVGFAVGAKYTAFVFAVPLFLTTLIFLRQIQKPLVSIGWFCLGCLGGFLISDGFWLYKLYTTFGNPFYPHFNWLFPSDNISANDIYSLDFSKSIPTTIKKTLLSPFYFLRCEIRFKILWFAFIINLLSQPFINKEDFKKTFNVNLTLNDFILTFCFFSFLFWIKTFAVPRYYVPFLGLTTIIAVIIYLKIFYIIKNIILYIFKKYSINKEINFKKVQDIYTYIILFLLLILCFPKYTQPIEKKLVRVPIVNKLLDVENVKIPDSSIIFVDPGNAIVIPFQNPNAKYYLLNDVNYTRLNSYILSNKKINEIKNEIQQNKNNIYLISELNIENKKVSPIEIEKEIIQVNKMLLTIPQNNKKKRLEIQSVLKKTKMLIVVLHQFGLDTNSSKCIPIRNDIANDSYIYHAYLCKLETR